jgi:two-component system LytT family response regulator
MTPLRVLIVDDESMARRRLRRLLASEPNVTIVGDCADGRAALAAIAATAPDLVFLDVQMPELDGFEVLQAIAPAHMPAIVFVTGFDRYALRAFDVHAIDYLLKPFTPERFREAVARARGRIERREPAAGPGALASALRSAPQYLARVTVTTSGRSLVVELSSVDWIGAEDNYVRLHAGEREFLLRATLKALEPKLDPDRFTRIHRSAIVQIDRIAEIHPASHGDCDLLLRDGTTLPLSRTWRERVQRALRHC